MIAFIINDREVNVDLKDGRTTLKTIRKDLSLTGTKEVCGEGDCGSCMVLLGELKKEDGMEYKAVNSCLLPSGELSGKHVVSIEGLNLPVGLGLIQKCFAEKFASQCGFCTPGFVIALTAYLLNTGEWNEKDAEHAIAGNMCRCTGYGSIKRAVRLLGEKMTALPLSETKPGTQERIAFLSAEGVLPGYFTSVPTRIKKTQPEAEWKTAGRIVGGGTDLFAQKKEDLENETMTFLSERKDMREISQDGDTIIMGGGVTFEEFRNSEIITGFFPQAKEVFSRIASLPIRNRATIAGNIVNASPLADMSVFLLAQNAELSLASRESRRNVPLREFFKGYKQTDRKENEILESIRFKAPEGTLVHFEKVSKRPHLAMATVNSGISIRVKDGTIEAISLSAGGVAPFPLFLAKTCEFLAGKKVSPETIEEATGIADTEISPLSDAHGSEAYKRLLLKRLIAAHFITLFPAETENMNI